MGMESYNITILAQGVSIEYENSYQKLIGYSMVDILDIEEKLRSIGMRCIQDTKWLFDDCLELYLYQKNGKLQGIEIKGCLSWLKEGVIDSFQIFNKYEEWYGEFEVYILGEKVKCNSEEQLNAYIQESYKKKIDLFNKQYNNIELKVTCGEFYKEMRKRTKWYYKWFYRLR